MKAFNIVAVVYALGVLTSIAMSLSTMARKADFNSVQAWIANSPVKVELVK